MEPIVSRHLIFYLENNYLMEPYQSTYRNYYSTETALNIITDTLIINRSTHLNLYATIGISSDFDTRNNNILN